MLDELWAAEHLPPPKAAEFQAGNLEAKFVAPPFTVLDTRQGYWQDRRRAWLSLGIKSELGRGADLLSLSPAEGARARWADNGLVQGGQGEGLTNAWARDKIAGTGAVAQQGGQGGGTSIFDPVLCELMYRWFAPEGGLVLDPFAGGSVRGIVAAKLGHPYTGVDLALAQLEANRAQAAAILAPGEPVPSWLHGDSRGMDDLLPAGELYDMVLTCPPYYDLEVYSDDPADLSNMAEYSGFLEGYGEVIRRAALRLRDERFMVLVVSEVRDPAGFCRGLVPDTIRAAQAAGLHLYNEAVLINSAGSLPLRVTKYMEASRKLGRAHQNVLCFLKGKPPRGWSWERAAPPSPQLSLELAADPPSGPVPSQQPLGPAAVPVPEAAPVGAEPPPEAERPFITSNVPVEPIVGWGLASAEDHAAAETTMADELRDDGRWVDQATGELFRDEGGEPGPPVQPLAAPEPEVPYVAPLITSTGGYRCAGCGSPPIGPLSSTVIGNMARGACDNCGGVKVYRRA